nr:MAG TPA: Sterol methyltransferase C-terminal [Caudoviricetes sp.]
MIYTPMFLIVHFLFPFLIFFQYISAIPQFLP